VVAIRPTGAPAVTLAEARGEIRNLQQFAAMATQQITVEIRSTAAVPSRDTFVALVTNGSPVTVESATITVEMSVTCRVAGRPGILVAAPPTPLPTPAPTPRIIQEVWTGTASVTSIAARSTVRVAVRLSGGVCLAFTTWSARTRVTDVRIAQ
jgi:hypothetical protein